MENYRQSRPPPLCAYCDDLSSGNKAQPSRGMITTAFTRPWEICTPPLTRYLEAVYIDEFFNAGKLRISSFRVFRRHPDEQRGDPSEGTAIQEIISPNARHSILGINGQEAYVLCCGTVESKDMVASFGTDAGFRIKNPLGFADAVSRQIPGFIGGAEGLCHYRDSTLLRKYDERTFRPPVSQPDPEAWAREYDRYVGEHCKDSFFLKQNRYAQQGEYRFIWFASGQERDYIDIVCPDASRFCERLT
jgi:hypothetical protein